jgi:hypothetical protein
MPPGGSMDPRLVLKLLFHENHKIVNNSATTDAREKTKHSFKIHRFLEIFKDIFN